jgi:hypothetical protein
LIFQDFFTQSRFSRDFLFYSTNLLSQFFSLFLVDKHSQMRNLILLILLCGFSLQCASNKKSERARIEREYKIPQFSNDSTQDLAFQVAFLMDDLKKSFESGKEIDKSEIQSKVINLLDQNKSNLSKMSLEDIQKLTSWSMELVNQFIQSN